MNENELLFFIRDQLGLRAIDVNTAMGQVRGWDSLRHLQLIIALEEHFSIEIPTDLIGQLTSAQALLDHFKELGKVAV